MSDTIFVNGLVIHASRRKRNEGGNGG